VLSGRIPSYSWGWCEDSTNSFGGSLLGSFGVYVVGDLHGIELGPVVDVSFVLLVGVGVGSAEGVVVGDLRCCRHWSIRENCSCC
jgi:hypothetical protein